MKNECSWHDACHKMYEFNKEHNITTKGNNEMIFAVVVISEDSFDEIYPLEQRSYIFDSDNKAFIPGQIGSSIFSRGCLDGTDRGVRLDWYIPSEWKPEYCYFIDTVEEVMTSR